jgi:RNA polymerase sigma factor for flagellar operon FliA
MIAEIEKVGEKEVGKILTDVIVNRLDEKERLVIAFVFCEGLNIKEIAEILECSESEALDLYIRVIRKIEEPVALRLNGKRIF